MGIVVDDNRFLEMPLELEPPVRTVKGIQSRHGLLPGNVHGPAQGDDRQGIAHVVASRHLQADLWERCRAVHGGKGGAAFRVVGDIRGIVVAGGGEAEGYDAGLL